MSTPTRTPYRLSINTSASIRGLEDCTTTHSGWHTPISAQDHRRPSLTYSALSEPSPSSLPTTPGYRVPSAHDSVPFYFGDGHCSAKNFHCAQGIPSMARPVQHPGLTSFDIMTGDDARVHMSMSMSPVCDSFNTSFHSSASSDSWDQPQHSGIQQFGPPISFRPSPYGSLDSLSESEHIKSMTPESVLQHSQPVLQPAHTFDSMAGHPLFPPAPLVIPTEVHEPDAYSYAQPLDSQINSPMDQATMQSSSFDSFASFSHWPHMDTVSPMHEYSLPEDGDLHIRMKVDSPVHNIDLSSHPEFEGHPMDTPKRTRARNRSSLSKRHRAGGHQLVKNFYGLDVAIDPKTMEMDTRGVIKKKNINIETKRWECSVAGCGSRSARKEHLRRHELSHQPEKQFHCNLPKCGRAITRSDNLIQHLMTHARPPKPGKRNYHHSRKRIEQMVLDTMTDKKLAERTITNLGKAIDREADKWPGMESEDTSFTNTNDDD